MNRLAMHKRLLILGALTAALGVSAYSHSAETPPARGKQLLPDPHQLFRKALRAVHNDHEDSVYAMTLYGRDGKPETVRRMRVWFKSAGDGAHKLLLKFFEPAHLRGTGLLTVVEKDKGAEQWLYLPAYKRTRKIRQGNENESFLGSDFTMADISVQHEESFDFKNEGVAKCGDTDCYRLVGTPKPGLDRDYQAYAKKVVFIRVDNGLNVRTEFYNNSMQMEKVMTLQGLRKTGAMWTADRMEMNNVLVNHRTVIEFEKRNIDEIPADSNFNVSFLERGP